VTQRRERILLGAILGAALLLRLGHLYAQRTDVLFEHPILDEQRYVDDARRMAAGQLAEDRPYWQPPGILYVLTACFRVAGPGLAAPRVVQALVATAACLLLFGIARRLFGSGVALAAAAIGALHGVLVFESGELLPPTWIFACDLLALFLLLRAESSARGAFGAGLALGVSALFSPVVLPFAAVAALWLWLQRGPRVRVRVAARVLAFGLGVALPIAPVAARNHAHGGEWVLISSNGGLNLYLGNNERYPETFALRPGRHWDELTSEPERAGITAPGAASSWFARRAGSFVAAHPAQAAALYARKLYLFFHGAEIPRDSDLYAARARSPVLRALVWPRPLDFPDGILIPLALAGAALLWRERKRLAILYAFLAVQALVTAAFFVTARHRVPALAGFALFAAAGAVELARRRRFIVLVVALVIVLNLPVREAALSFAAEEDFYRGVATLRELRDPVAAAELLRRSAARDPGDSRAWFELGNALDAAGRGDEAALAWTRAAAADPWDVRPLRRASAVLARRGDLDGAIAAIQSNVDARLRDDTTYAPDWLNLAFLRARAGQLDRAIEDLHAAARADPRYFREHAPRLPRGELDQRFGAALDDLLR
jgi:4-amino-4-deoxy-L-arabinose transferase-like glycosyltransferase